MGGLEIVLCVWAGLLSRLLYQVGSQATCSLLELGCRLCPAIGQGLTVSSAVRQGYGLGFTAEQHRRLDSKATQGHYSVSLIIWSQKLCLTVGRTAGLASCPSRVVE